MGEGEGGREVLIWMALAAVLAVVLYAGLEPFELEPRNEVQWAEAGPGLRFDDGGIAYTVDPLDWEPSDAARPLSIEMWLEAADESPAGIGRILSLYDGHRVIPLLIAQWRSDLLVRDRLRGQSRRRRHYRELAVRDALRSGEAHFVVLSSGDQGTAVYVDGELARGRSDLPIIGPGEAFDGRLLLGASPTGRERWQGEIGGIAVYQRALDQAEVEIHRAAVAIGGFRALLGEPGLLGLYPLDEGQGHLAMDASGVSSPIRIPATFRPLERELLRRPRSQDRYEPWFTRDVTLNLLGLTPLGFLLALLMRRRFGLGVMASVISSALLGASLSLGIEGVQSAMPGRDSSLFDLILNGLGTTLGAVVAVATPWAGTPGARAETPRPPLP